MTVQATTTNLVTVGPDRPGILPAEASVLTHLGGNGICGGSEVFGRLSLIWSAVEFSEGGPSSDIAGALGDVDPNRVVVVIDAGAPTWFLAIFGSDIDALARNTLALIEECGATVTMVRFVDRPSGETVGAMVMLFQPLDGFYLSNFTIRLTALLEAGSGRGRLGSPDPQGWAGLLHLGDPPTHRAPEAADHPIDSQPPRVAKWLRSVFDHFQALDASPASREFGWALERFLRRMLVVTATATTALVTILLHLVAHWFDLL